MTLRIPARKAGLRPPARDDRRRDPRRPISPTATPCPRSARFAAEQRANPLTVAKAYQGFQDEGLIVVKRGVGMFVAPGARARLRESERSRFVSEEWPEIRARMERLGIDPAELLDRETRLTIPASAGIL